MSALMLTQSITTENPTVGDIFLVNGKCRMTATLAEEVAQLLRTRFLMFKGEWFLDLTAGIPYLQSILGQKNTTAAVSAIFRHVIVSCPGVETLDQFNATFTGRTYSLSFTCTLTDGAVLTSSDFAPFVVGGV